MRPFLLRFLAGALSLGLLTAACGRSAPTQQPAPQQDQGKPAASATNPESQPQAPEAKEKVKFAYTSISGSMASSWIAKEGGYFDKYGIDAELVYIASSSKATQSMLAGEVPLMLVATSGVVAAHLQGGDTVMIANTIDTVVFSLMVQPSIRSVQDLRGKKIGVSRFGASSDTSARIFLRKNGLEPGKDVAIIQIGEIPAILAAMQSGAVDAGVVSPPTTVRARKAGFTELADLGKLGIKYAHTGLATTRKFAGEKPQVVEGALKALVEGINRLKRDPDFAKKVIGKYANLDDPEVLEETWRVYAQEYLLEKPYPSEEGIRTILEELAANEPKAKGADPKDFYDDSFMRKLEQSGFFDQLGVK